MTGKLEQQLKLSEVDLEAIKHSPSTNQMVVYAKDGSIVFLEP
jgi:hypothetical protein